MFSRVPFGGSLLQEDGTILLQEDGFDLLWKDEEKIAPYSFKPLMDFKETIKWNTDVIKCYSKEQRVSIRVAPITEYDYRFYFNEQEFREIKAMMNTWNNKYFAIPLWTDSTLISNVLSSDTEILFDTTSADYQPLEHVAIYDNTNVYYRYVSEVLSDRIVLDGSVGFTASNVLIMPCKDMIMVGPIKFQRGAVNNNFASVIFRTVNNHDLSANGNFTQYKNIDVLLDCQPILSGINESIEATVDVFDSGAGIIEYVRNSGYLTKQFTCNFNKMTKAERFSLKRFLHKMKGKRGEFWLPSFHNDIVIQSNIPSSQTYIDVASFGYGYFLPDEPSSFVIEMKNGTRYFNTITGSTRNQNIERFTLENPFGVTILLSNIKRVMFINKVRFDSDSAEFNYPSRQICQLSMPVIGVV